MPAMMSPTTGGTLNCLNNNGANKMMPSTTKKIHVGSVMRGVVEAACMALKSIICRTLVYNSGANLRNIYELRVMIREILC